ncbi:MAG: Two component transcriptional regulator, winged helix family [Candidatus Amesbacteria bacterium GW2011_GWB1_47_19]|nr:MAG: Two component transcriptional regulator, winged helix family [Candidatus Amesbacteria bacterium GW2011_GWA1_44_24]KKU31231.1 MAG: Two component transcriptional regulator, winged helix family [Candidatus Amesbacteria bacterium GW2011_GWC1_46_24]KKU67115.1 MAG: Two component transcriptional regulator, winged helix family [Candidatus Amesbacteria bacterium GW2011_GWB1_47_19]OGD05470.1 MAG: DNA-binding response regulator [Candidatus Amesbacteria bacterium RIFOXYB1_FULL_47_13]HBC72984.1 DNA-
MRLLVVEDEHRIANAIKKGLQQERYAVDVAYTGPEGYDLAVTEDYDLLILDLMLPGMDGLTLCRKLRDGHRHTPVLILTAKSQIRDKVTGLDTGADDYLTKPFSFSELLARIRALTRRPPVTSAPVLTAGDIKLDTTQFSLSRAGKNISLTQKEFSLLEYLLINTGKILTKDQIISHVWDYDADILPNTVEVYIRNLRNKIDHPFPKLPPRIHTVRGFGYKIS